MSLQLSAILGVLCTLLDSAGLSTAADLIQFRSGENPTALLELYTSEGCSSCPSAEAWLSGLKTSPRLWRDFVPVAFHVDYWDSLGWKDPFGSKDYSEREHQSFAQWRSKSVYTPGFVYLGKEWRGFFQRESLPQPAAKPVGVLNARSPDGKSWNIGFKPTRSGQPAASYEFSAALLGFDLTSEVKAGENRGRKLVHDFLVLDLAKTAAGKSGEVFQANLQLTQKITGSKRLAVAVWVARTKSMEPIQALGGWLPDYANLAN